jgi:hypothetical protein
MLRILGALVLVVAAVALAAFGPFHSKTSHPHAAANSNAPVVVFTDTPDMSWPVMAPEQAPRASDRPALRPERSPQPNWKGLSLSVADAGAPATATAQYAMVDRAADLSVGMSREERRRLIAQSRELETASIAPKGYCPGIVVITAGGGGGDGICR